MNRKISALLKLKIPALAKRFYSAFLKSPGFWIFLFFSFGIICSPWLKLGICSGLFLSFLLVGAVFLFWKAHSDILQMIGMIFLFFSFSFLGSWIYQIKVPKQSPELSREISSDLPLGIKAKVVSLPQKYDYYQRVLCRIIWWNKGDGFKKGSGYFWLNYQGEESLYPKDEIITVVKLKPIKKFSNFLLPDTTRHWEKAGIYFSGQKLSSAPIIKIQENKISFFRWVGQVRNYLSQELKRSGASGQYLLSALLLGERTALPSRVEEAFQSLGVSHILVVSGLHLSLVGGFSFLLILGLLRFFPPLLKRYDIYPLAGFLSLFPITFYALLTGFRLPTIRAWIMTLILFFALILYRTRYLLNSLGWAGIFILLFLPASLFEPSFQFSFLAVGALIIYFPRLWEILAGKELELRAQLVKMEQGKILPGLKWLGVKSGTYFYGLLLASILIQLFCMPLQVYYFSRFSPYAPLLNLSLIPLCGFWVLPLGILGLISELASSSFAGYFYQLAGEGALLMEKIVRTFAGIPKASLLLRPIALKEALAWYLLLFFFFSFLGRLQKRKLRNLTPKIYFWLAGMIFSLSLIIAFSVQAKRFHLQPEQVRVSVLDVGAGQSIIIELPQKQAILLDGAGRLGKINLGEMVVAKALLCRGIKKLRAVVLSHPELDHSYGLEYILRHFSVKEFWLPKKFNQHSLKLLELAEKKGIKIKWLSCETPPVELSGARFWFFHPCPDELSRLNLNDSSLVIKMEYQGWGFLFPGDISSKIEKKLVKKYPQQLSSQFLIAPHHGSGKSSSEEFLKAVSPQIILISTRAKPGSNLPSPKALKRMKKSGAKILRTDQNGEIDLILNSDKFEIKTCLLP